jgi:hypothetical protein
MDRGAEDESLCRACASRLERDGSFKLPLAGLRRCRELRLKNLLMASISGARRRGAARSRLPTGSVSEGAGPASHMHVRGGWCTARVVWKSEPGAAVGATCASGCRGRARQNGLIAPGALAALPTRLSRDELQCLENVYGPYPTGYRVHIFQLMPAPLPRAPSPACRTPRFLRLAGAGPVEPVIGIWAF